MNQEEQRKKMGRLIAKCWSDEAFKKKLLADPGAVLKAEGMAAPAGVQVRAVENTDKVFHLVIPAKPTDLSDEDLDKVAAGIQYTPVLPISIGIYRAPSMDFPRELTDFTPSPRPDLPDLDKYK